MSGWAEAEGEQNNHPLGGQAAPWAPCYLGFCLKQGLSVAQASSEFLLPPSPVPGLQACTTMPGLLLHDKKTLRRFPEDTRYT